MGLRDTSGEPYVSMFGASLLGANVSQPKITWSRGEKTSLTKRKSWQAIIINYFHVYMFDDH